MTDSVIALFFALCDARSCNFILQWEREMCNIKKSLLWEERP